MQKRVKEIQSATKTTCQAAGRNEFCLQRIWQSAGWMFSSAGANASTFCLVCHPRGSPFSDVNYTVNLQIFPQEQIEQIQPQALPLLPRISISPMGFMFPLPPLFLAATA